MSFITSSPWSPSVSRFSFPVILPLILMFIPIAALLLVDDACRALSVAHAAHAASTPHLFGVVAFNKLFVVPVLATAVPCGVGVVEGKHSV